MFTESETKRLVKIIAIGVVTLVSAACTPWFFNYLHDLGVINAPMWAKTLVAIIIMGLYLEYSGNPLIRLMEERKERMRVKEISERYRPQNRKKHKKHYKR